MCIDNETVWGFCTSIFSVSATSIFSETINHSLKALIRWIRCLLCLVNFLNLVVCVVPCYTLVEIFKLKIGQSICVSVCLLVC